MTNIKSVFFDADNTIINPIQSNNNIVINNVKSIGLFKKLEKLLSFLFFFAIPLSFLPLFLFSFATFSNCFNLTLISFYIYPLEYYIK